MTKKYRHLYGPVPSRRLGRSLGIDLVPHKVCTYDCVYCQIGRTTEKTLQRKEYVPENEILEEVASYLREGEILPDYLSLGGSGEPTLHSGIRSIIREIKAMTDIPVAVITNGSLLSDEQVREDLLEADVVLPSMDAASAEVFERINRPCFGFSVEQMIEGMVAFRKRFMGQIWLEILFCRDVNDGPDEIRKMREAVERIRPDQIHLNTVVRPPSEGWTSPIREEEMERIRSVFGEKACIITEFDRRPEPGKQRDVREEILRVLERRPLSLEDLSKGMGITGRELGEAIDSLIREGRVRARLFDGRQYYEAVI
jgi:wyosine [tRNA(Phe)-imidazoG37] synthetase (radical SAM superfamily)